MPFTRIVLIDTSIFDRYVYDFASPEIAALIQVASQRKLTLLLPDVIEREVKRHIAEKSYAAQHALKKARKDAPFLRKWTHWPGAKATSDAKNDIEAAALSEWLQFLKHFKVKKLLYDGIKMSQVMDWYDHKQPPFGEGGKQKWLWYRQTKPSRVSAAPIPNSFTFQAFRSLQK